MKRSSRRAGVAYDERTGFKVRGDRMRQDGERGIWTTDPDGVHPQRFLRNPGPDGRTWTPGIAKNESHPVTLLLRSTTWTNENGYQSIRRTLFAFNKQNGFTISIGATATLGAAIHIESNPFTYEVEPG